MAGMERIQSSRKRDTKSLNTAEVGFVLVAAIEDEEM